MLNWSSLSSKLRYRLKKVLGTQACLAVASLLRIIGLHLRNYLLNKSTQINTHKNKHLTFEFKSDKHLMERYTQSIK